MLQKIRKVVTSIQKLAEASDTHLAAIDDSRKALERLTEELGRTSRPAQLQLAQSYRQAAAGEGVLPSFDQAELRLFSQNGEDGILLLLFSALETTDKRCVEICAGDGLECNSANLIVNHGWHGMLVDGNDQLLARGRSFYRSCRDTFRLPPKLVHAWITRSNVNQLVEENGFSGEIDLLSIDMDGVDYWIWQALHCIQPRVVIAEYNNRWSAEQSVTVPYADDFRADPSPTKPGFFGASLAAFAKLARQKGYRLVGSNRFNTNAFFIRDGIGERWFPEVSVASCLTHAYALHQHATKYPLIKDLPVVEV